MTRTAIALAGLLLAATPAAAQMATPGQQPYGAMTERPIKALSADDIAGLRAGRGMAMALPAELNRYPGPMHVLEHEAALGLSAAQKEELTGQMAGMRAEAIVLGESIIVREGELDALFASGAADAAGIDRLTAEIARLQGQLRAVHLRTHLATRATLDAAQRATYQTVRGYTAGGAIGATPAHKH